MPYQCYTIPDESSSLEVYHEVSSTFYGLAQMVHHVFFCRYAKLVRVLTNPIFWSGMGRLGAVGVCWVRPPEIPECVGYVGYAFPKYPGMSGVSA